jgi:hypothetical protein
VLGRKPVAKRSFASVISPTEEVMGSQGLGKISERIEVTIERDRVIAPIRRKKFLNQQFSSLVQSTVSDVTTCLGNLERIFKDCLAQNTAWFLDSEPNIPFIDGRVGMIDDVVVWLLRGRELVRTADPEPPFCGLASAVNALMDSVLRQTVAFLKQFAPFVELDGRVIDKGMSISAVFQPNIDAETKRISSELTRLSGRR